MYLFPLTVAINIFHHKILDISTKKSCCLVLEWIKIKFTRKAKDSSLIAITITRWGESIYRPWVFVFPKQGMDGKNILAIIKCNKVLTNAFS